ncbi:MAG TPA: adenylate/guanylate cyclase domain-containing protein [Kofleriaceae bacterium]|nr:adenylate/guanylate cyclase domain-containing protein [Kofleriaceae bacterium]
MTLALAIALAALATVLATVAWRLRRERDVSSRRIIQLSEELERIDRAFSLFAPATLVDRIGAGAPPEPQKRDVTVLFSDLQGFTALSERLDPADLVEVLNGYFREMSTVITTRHGHVSKFLGDGIMALFGALEDNPWQSADAVRAALAMREATFRYNEKLRQNGGPELRTGIGVHRGTAVTGIMGNQFLAEFTVVGAAVNLASRVENLTRLHGVDVLITEQVRAGLDGRFRLRELPAVDVKGMESAVVTFAVDGFLAGGEPALPSQGQLPRAYPGRK